MGESDDARDAENQGQARGDKKQQHSFHQTIDDLYEKQCQRYAEQAHAGGPSKRDAGRWDPSGMSRNKAAGIRMGLFLRVGARFLDVAWRKHGLVAFDYGYIGQYGKIVAGFEVERRSE